MLSGFDHVTIVVHDVELAVSRYTSLLGSAPTWRGEHPDLGTRAALFGLSNSLIELVGPIPGVPEAEGMRQLLASRGEGLYALAFATDDAAQCSKVLRERGVRAAPPESGEARGSDGAIRSYRTVELSARGTRGVNVLAVERSDVSASALRGSAPAAAAAVHALDHVVVRTSQPEAALALYGQGLGLRLALDREFNRTRMLFFRIGGVTVEVVEDASSGESDRLWGVAYRVRDIDAAHLQLTAAGFAPGPVRDGNKPGTRVCSLHDGTCGVPTLILRDPARE
jgi:catechol 2,3-dioxygenase-like lactoylglutathione lyase family enzyme